MKKNIEKNQDEQAKKIIECCRGELLGRYTLYGWDDRRFDQKYWGQLERNWRCWKGIQQKRKRILEIIQEEEEEEQGIEEPRIEEWDEEDEIGNLQDPYNELQSPWDENP